MDDICLIFWGVRFPEPDVKGDMSQATVLEKARSHLSVIMSLPRTLMAVLPLPTANPPYEYLVCGVEDESPEEGWVDSV